MFALGIRYLNGWAMAAADGANKERAEWPPHPDRVFMALAAAWFESGEDARQGEALRWLEALAPPAIAASDANYRHAWQSKRPVVSYVPVNDGQRGRNLPKSNAIKKLKETGLALLPEYRARQPRSFPVAIPHHDAVHLTWSNTPLPDCHRMALNELCSKVTHVGHSASLVQMWLHSDLIVPSWIPKPGVAKHRLRITGKGRLAYLEARYNRKNTLRYATLKQEIQQLKSEAKLAKGKSKKLIQAQCATKEETLKKDFPGSTPTSLRPEPGLWHGYSKPVSATGLKPMGSIFDPRVIVFSLSGKRLSLPATLKLTTVMRKTVLQTCTQPVPEWVSGHTPNGAASVLPHLAIIPLPFVDYAYADGRVMGIGLVLPRGVDQHEAAHCLEQLLHDNNGMTKRTKLFDSRWLECSAELETRDTPPMSLQIEHWTRPSRIWASATPIVLDRHYNGKDKWQRAAESVKDACERIGLSRPREVVLHPVSLLKGVPHSRDFPHITRKKDGGRCHHAHAVIKFDEKVQGPLLVGAGRFKGYGLCRPMSSGVSHE